MNKHKIRFLTFVIHFFFFVYRFPNDEFMSKNKKDGNMKKYFLYDAEMPLFVLRGAWCECTFVPPKDI